MGKSKSSPRVVETTATSVPQWAKPYWQRAMARAEGESKRPYERYGGPRIASWTPQEEAAFGGYENLASAPKPFMEYAAEQLGGTTNWGDLNQRGRSRYTDPYMQDVSNIEKGYAEEEFNRQLMNQRGRAVQSGAFGGYRGGLQEFQGGVELARQKGEIQKRGLQESLQFGARQHGVEQQQRQASVALAGQLGPVAQRQEIERLRGLERVGMTQRERAQEALNVGYEDFIRQRDWERGQISNLFAMMSGAPMPIQQTVSGVTPEASTVSQLLGLGVGAAGLSQLFGGNKTSAPPAATP